MAKTSTGARFNLGEPYDTNLAAYCKVMHGANVTQVVKDAIDLLIKTKLANNPGLRDEYQEALQRLRP